MNTLEQELKDFFENLIDCVAEYDENWDMVVAFIPYHSLFEFVKITKINLDDEIAAILKEYHVGIDMDNICEKRGLDINLIFPNIRNEREETTTKTDNSCTETI